MRALRLDFDSRRLSLADHPEPPPPAPGQLRLRLLESGICGTDRGLAEFEFGRPPEGESTLILGHEALAEIEGAGTLVVPMVRRDCAPGCSMCARGRRDNCLTGAYLERGIFGLHGYLCELANDSPKDLVEIPPTLADLAVLVEPASVVEKAWEITLRLHAPQPRTVLIPGAGPIGILTAWRALAAGFDVTVLSREPEDSFRAQLLAAHGVRYTRSLDAVQADIIFEACGSAPLAVESMRTLRRLGVVLLLGARPAQVHLPTFDMIIGNHVLAASVNASRDHFASAVAQLQAYDPRWLHPLIHRLSLDRAAEAIFAPPDAVKIVHRIA